MHKPLTQDEMKHWHLKHTEEIHAVRCQILLTSCTWFLSVTWHREFSRIFTSVRLLYRAATWRHVSPNWNNTELKEWTKFQSDKENFLNHLFISEESSVHCEEMEDSRCFWCLAWILQAAADEQSEHVHSDRPGGGLCFLPGSTSHTDCWVNTTLQEASVGITREGSYVASSITWECNTAAHIFWCLSLARQSTVLSDHIIVRAQVRMKHGI